MPLYVDGHLDLSFNVTFSDRDLTLELEALRQQEKKQEQEALVTLPELRRGHVGVVFGTIFTMPLRSVRAPGAKPLTAKEKARSYETPEQARAQALEQLELYERWEEAGEIRILRSKADLGAHLGAWDAGERAVGVVLLMEGADPLVQPADLEAWVNRGLRLLGPAWQKTRYSGGTHAPGPLSDLGVELMAVMKDLGLPLDVSHMAEESFWQAMAQNPAFVLASHANARALTPTDRHLSDEMLLELKARDAVVGLVLGNPFIKAGITRGMPKASVTLRDVRAQAEHVAGLVGWENVAIGSDFDGGFGVQETPAEIARGADFATLGEAVPEAARAGFLGENWLRFLRRVLPAS